MPQMCCAVEGILHSGNVSMRLRKQSFLAETSVVLSLALCHIHERIKTTSVSFIA